MSKKLLDKESLKKARVLLLNSDKPSLEKARGFIENLDKESLETVINKFPEEAKEVEEKDLMTRKQLISGYMELYAKFKKLREKIDIWKISDWGIYNKKFKNFLSTLKRYGTSMSNFCQDGARFLRWDREIPNHPWLKIENIHFLYTKKEYKSFKIDIEKLEKAREEIKSCAENINLKKLWN